MDPGEGAAQARPLCRTMTGWIFAVGAGCGASLERATRLALRPFRKSFRDVA